MFLGALIFLETSQALQNRNEIWINRKIFSHHVLFNYLVVASENCLPMRFIYWVINYICEPTRWKKILWSSRGTDSGFKFSIYSSYLIFASVENNTVLFQSFVF